MTQLKPILLIFVDVVKEAIKTKNARSFIQDWILYTMIGIVFVAALWIISLVIILGSFWALQGRELIIENSQKGGFLLYIGALLGEVLGIMQWRALRQYIPKAFGWILVTNLGCVIGSLVGASLFEINPQSAPTLIQIIVCIAFCLGLTQCLFLKRYSHYWQEWICWIPLTIVCWILSWVGLGRVSSGGGGFWGLIGFVLGLAAIQGGIPGLYLVFLLRDYWR